MAKWNVYSRLEVVDLIFDKTSKDNGFVLLEALISFGLVSSLLIVTIPFLIELFHIRELSKEQVELSRVLYEEAMFWSRQEQYGHWTSGHNEFQTKSGKFSIVITGVDQFEKRAEIQAVSRSK